MTVGRSRTLFPSTTLFASMLAFVLAASLPAGAADEWHTSSSLIGPSKYGENFQRYDYVNPDAPKGGTYNSVVTGTFDSFNPYIVQG
ncbi:MAG: ABC transporter substrate-binding protein, partial [Mesorhizobium sp.]